MADRMDEVSPAHQETFDWVYDYATLESRPWDNLVEWLKSGSGCYWVHGKAGAGKSTFMKFFSSQTRTRDALSQWAGSKGLLIASFFFWNLGTSLQKSQVGLLRSLLHDVLQARPELAPHILPNLYRAAAASRQGHLADPSFAELKKALQLLSKQQVVPIKVCLFIDGVDEYHGNHSELAEFFTTLPKGCVKTLLSSRPVPACIDAFSGLPNLQLQHFTYADIRLYTVDRVSKNVRFQQLLDEDESQATELINEIVNKASGVFLWVIIVVNRLLDGLRNFDGLDDLRCRLEGLPTDLQALYDHMLNKLDPLYQQQAAQIFQIVFRSFTTNARYADVPLTTMLFSHTDTKNPEYALELPIGVWTSAERYSKCVTTEGRLRSRCCGLIEVVQDWSILESKQRMIESRVSFLHRTVAEYIQMPEIWDGLLALTMKSGFDMNVSLLSASLCEIKTNVVQGIVDTGQHWVWRNLHTCLLYARLSESSTRVTPKAFIDELDRVMEHHWAGVTRWQYWDSRKMDFEISYSGVQSGNWTCSIFPGLDRRNETEDMTTIPSTAATINTVAAHAGLALYLRTRLEEDTSSITAKQLEQIAFGAISNHALNFQEKALGATKDRFAIFVQDDGTVPSETYVDILELVLRPEAFGDTWQETRGNVWLVAFRNTTKLVEHAQGFGDESTEDALVLWARMLENLARLGMNPDTRMDLEPVPGAHQQSALLVIMNLFEALPARRAYLRPSEASRATIKSLLEEQGARQREWIYGKLVRGPQRRTLQHPPACPLRT